MTSLGRHNGDTENENVNTQMSVVFMNFLNICLQIFPHQKCNFGKPLKSFLDKDERTDMCFNSIGAYSLLVGDGVKVLENIPWIIHTARSYVRYRPIYLYHYDAVKMGAIASQITSLAIVYPTVYSGADQSKHQRSASLAFVWGIHRGPVNSPHKLPVARKMFPFDDVIMFFKITSPTPVKSCDCSNTSVASLIDKGTFVASHSTMNLNSPNYVQQHFNWLTNEEEAFTRMVKPCILDAHPLNFKQWIDYLCQIQKQRIWEIHWELCDRFRDANIFAETVFGVQMLCPKLF